MKWLTPPILARVLVGLVILREVYGHWYAIAIDVANGRSLLDGFLWVMTSPSVRDGYQMEYLIGLTTAAVALLLCIAFAIDLVRKRMKINGERKDKG